MKFQLFPQHNVEGLLNSRPEDNCPSYWICLFQTKEILMKTVENGIGKVENKKVEPLTGDELCEMKSYRGFTTTSRSGILRGF